MSDQTRIEWCDATWNPCTGCTPISEACEHCYAERIAGRNLPATRCPECRGAGFRHYYGKGPETCRLCHGLGNVGFTPTFHPDRLYVPLDWRKPRRIFVCSMSDLFHEAFTDEQRDLVFFAMAWNLRHTFMVLTKRPDEMRRYFLGRIAAGLTWPNVCVGEPLPNVWLGVTAENQQRADERIPILLDTPAAVRFVSVEPMLGAVDLTDLTIPVTDACMDHVDALYCDVDSEDDLWHGNTIDWVILGGETGPGARPMQPEWALSVYRQCKAAGVPFFFKKWGRVDARGLGGEYEAMETTRELPEVEP